jgi:CRP-like cAMP-binding protein
MENAPQVLPDPTRNRLIELATSRAAMEFRRKLIPVELRFGDILHHAGVDQKHVYFPTTGVVSILYMMTNGSSAEIGLIGNDGLVGIPVALGAERSTTRAMVQVAGHGLRATATDVQKLISVDPTFRALLHRYVQVMLTQATQTAVCNRYHTTLQQLCRWILHSIDLSGSDEIIMTQQLMAEMLGVRREGVSVVAAQLRADGLIEYVRGKMRILDRKGVEQRACECYGAVVSEMRRLLPDKAKNRKD